MDKKKILVVDDEPNIRLLLTKMLEKEFTVLDASNGLEAIDAAKNMKPDLIFMDLLMPGIDGYTACSAIKQNPATSGIPVVILTAVGFELNKRLAERVGANGYMTKPFSLVDLRKTMDLLLEKSPSSS